MPTVPDVLKGDGGLYKQGGKEKMKIEHWEGIIVGVSIGLLLMLIVLPIVDNKNYKEGQIDAFTGKIVYELVVQDDSTRTWEKIK